MSNIDVKNLQESRDLTEEERKATRGGLVRIFESNVLTILSKGGVTAAGAIRDQRAKNDIFSW